MLCPLCKQEFEEKNMITFSDYAVNAYSKICEETMKLARGELSKEEKEDLRLLVECSHAISAFSYEYDRRVFKRMATLREQEQPSQD